jgi:hypothetical protein
MKAELKLLEPKKVLFRLDPDILKDIKRIAVEKEVTQNDLFVEGMKFIREKYKNLLKNYLDGYIEISLNEVK